LFVYSSPPGFLMSYPFHRISSRGFSTIEQALVLPFIIMLVLGMIDITNVLRAKYTADEGVRSALRCATATDSACGIAKAPNLNSERYFNVDLLPPDERQVPVVDVEASVEYLDVQPEVYAPVLRDPPEEAFEYSRIVTRYETTATIPYVVERLPYIERVLGGEEGYSISGSVDDNGTIAPSGPARMIRLMERATLRSDGGEAESRTFSFDGLPASILPTLPCAKDLDLSRRSVPERCRASSDSIPAFIYIQASSPTLGGAVDREYQAEVELSIAIQDEVKDEEPRKAKAPPVFKRRDLGGRRFMQRVEAPCRTNKGKSTCEDKYPSSTSASLVPRGAREDYVENKAKQTREEFEAHHRLDLPVERNFKLELKVFPSGDNKLPVVWRIESIDLVLPQYIEHQEKAACTKPIDACQLKANECEAKSAFGERARISGLTKGKEVTEEVSIGCYADPNLAIRSQAQSSCGEELRLSKAGSCGVVPGSVWRWDSEKFAFFPSRCSEQPELRKALPPGAELVRLERLPIEEKPQRVKTVTQKELKELREGTSDKYRCERFERKETRLLDLPDLNWKKPPLILLLSCTDDPGSVLPTLPEGVYYTRASFARTGEFRAPPPGVTLPSCLETRHAPKPEPVKRLGEFKEGEFPEICNTQTCLSSISRIVTLSDHGARLPDLKIAEKVGFESMQGLFGQLENNKSSYTGSVSTKYLTKTGSPPKADLSDAATVEVTTTVTVPSLLSIPGSGATYSVSSSRSQRIEKSFIR